MKFSQLTRALPDIEAFGGDPEIFAITSDSRAVGAGALFVAVPGYRSDGHAFIDQAVARGALAVLVQRDHAHGLRFPSVAVAIVADTRAALASVAAAFYGHPARALRVVGITGTDGKTTTSYLVNEVLEGAGQSTGMLGTVDYKVGPQWQSNPTRLTTPGAPEVQELLARMRDERVAYAIIESTSHGLELNRLDACEYDVAVFTNLTPDHLDQHGTFEAYRTAKGRLFTMLDEPAAKTGRRYAVLNVDDPEWAYFRTRSTAPAVTYGMSAEADVRATVLKATAAGSLMQIDANEEQFALNLPLPGLFNVSNALAAVAVGLGEGVSVDAIRTALEHFAGVPGRMERIDAGQPFTVIVDYAHTGDALTKVLQTLRPITRGKIIVLFGSAGERGHTRRSGMAGAAADLADVVVLTDEDPRSEDPMSIIDEMAAVLRNRGWREGERFLQILDRQEAIRAAIAKAGEDDVVLLAGKGHEQSIEVRGEALPWDDRIAARRALADLGYGA